MTGSVLVFERAQPDPFYSEPASQALARNRAKLLAVGDEILERFTVGTLYLLSVPISDVQLNRLVSGDTPENLVPARVRAALCVDEAADALEGLVFSFTKSIFPHTAVFDGNDGVFIVGWRRIPVRLIIERIGREVGISYFLAQKMWDAILSLLEEGIIIPGISVSKPGI